MIQLNTNGQTNISLLTDADFSVYFNSHFSHAFETYINNRFGISSEKLLEILKNVAPEEFV